MDSLHVNALLMIAVFIIGYLFITIEHYTKINKATVALMMAILCWIIQFATDKGQIHKNIEFLEEHLASISQVIFFLIGALTVVEIISAHKGFRVISELIKFRSKRKMLWVVSILTFFLSSVLDNLTTTIVMVSLLRKLIDENKDRLLIGGAIVIAANAGGVWTPIGDVTTTMLWIGGQISTWNIIRDLFIPSLVCIFAACAYINFMLEGEFPDKYVHLDEKQVEPLGRMIFTLGIGLLIFVPIFKILTGLPPFMGMLFALSVLWLVTDIAHRHFDDREHLRVPHILTKVDLSGTLFFLGILLCIGALYTMGLLEQLAGWLDAKIGSLSVISLAIGLASAVIDNVPLVAATMGMYSLEKFPQNHTFWEMIAYCAGTGGSVLIVGSAAGVVFMGMEKADFVWYIRKISLPALIGYFAGFLAYWAGGLIWP